MPANVTAISSPERRRPTTVAPTKVSTAAPETMATIKAVTLNVTLILELVVGCGAWAATENARIMGPFLRKDVWREYVIGGPEIRAIQSLNILAAC